MTEWQNGGMAEWRNGGMAEWWNGWNGGNGAMAGMVEWWEWQNGRMAKKTDGRRMECLDGGGYCIKK